MSERERFNPEQDKAYGQLRGFFGRAESEFPAAAKQLVNVVSGLVGDQRTTQKELQAGMKNVDVGLALIGDWLKETGAEEFEVNLGFGGGAKKAIGRTQVVFPTVSDLIRIRGKVNPELQAQIPPLLSLFSRQIRGGLDAGLAPRQIVGGLVAESVGSRLSADGSAVLRSTLEKPLGGHFEWIRQALGIPDVAEQPGFKPVAAAEAKPAATLKPLPEISRAEVEFIRKKNRIKEYLIQGGGMDYFTRTGDESKWEHVGEDGSVKQVFRPLIGVLRNEKVCLRRNVSDEYIDSVGSAVKLRAETRFLERVKNPHFVKVYAHAPLEATDREGVGKYSPSQHWEIVDYVDGITVERGWSQGLTPAVKLKTILAACVCEYDATHSDPPVRLSDFKTGAFRVQSDGSIKMIDVQVHEDYTSGDESESRVIAKELAMLCLEIFPGKYRESLSSQAIDAVFNPTLQEIFKRTALPGEQFPSLEEILRGSQMPDDLQKELKTFFDFLKLWRLKSKLVPEALLNRILPIAQRLEREEGAIRAEKIAAEKRQETQRRAAEKGAEQAESKTENWEGAVKKLIEDPFAQIAYEQTQSVMAAAAAYSLNAEISNGSVAEEQFIGLVKRIAALSQNMRPKKAQPRLLLQWPEHQRLFVEDEISRTAYEATGSVVAAAAAFSLREEIMAGTIAEEKFVPFVREVATLVQKTRSQIKH